ncbi:hypothetical protein [Flavobacterium caseinilyticum]|uniref:Uncharacterized protein n=1 Tax=Flavobacterium caseinilyticum TaxID=2541732 RepID=A0A4R5AM03_9FLAO|nr:hypothetical protein [Flavobacterium caseinilyticum]TDD73653.1 hypothetical protein E0F89_16890 [Flavobacterium caseinilyticum]
MVNCTPKSGGQFALESGGQFAPKLVVNLHWNRVVNLTGFSTNIIELKKQLTEVENQMENYLKELNLI